MSLPTSRRGVTEGVDANGRIYVLDRQAGHAVNARAAVGSRRLILPARVKGIPVAAAVLVQAALAACGGANSPAASGEWRAQIDTLGDTVVVRTLEGSEWGTAELVPELRIGVLEGEEHEMLGQVLGFAVTSDGDIYLFDRQVPALRKFAADGEYLGTLGGRGNGPGEYANSDGGLTVLTDGRVVLRDPGNGRFTVYGRDGEYLESWRTTGGAFTDIPLYRTPDGGFFSYNFAQGTRGFVRYGADGTPRDTLALPEQDVEAVSLRARSEEGGRTTMAARPVPFASTALWTFHPDGHFVVAVSDRFRVDLLRGEDEVLRLEREVDAVPVSAAARSAAEERTIRALRRIDPSWRWEGPPVPRVKPILRSLQAGEDGRLWLQLHQAGERVPEEEGELGPDGQTPIPQFREPVVFDVFEPDGRYLGRVEAPEGFQTSPPPIFRGEHVWATQRDELDVQYLVRYRIEPVATGGS